jgi:hypothetical protein
MPYAHMQHDVSLGAWSSSTPSAPRPARRRRRRRPRARRRDARVHVVRVALVAQRTAPPAAVTRHNSRGSSTALRRRRCRPRSSGAWYLPGDRGTYPRLVRVRLRHAWNACCETTSGTARRWSRDPAEVPRELFRIQGCEQWPFARRDPGRRPSSPLLTRSLPAPRFLAAGPAARREMTKVPIPGLTGVVLEDAGGPAGPPDKWGA